MNIKYWTLFFCLMLGIQANAQAFHSSSANLFTWGKLVKEVNQNFENLRNNVKSYADKRYRIKILKYEECGVLKDSSQIAEMIQYNYLHAPAFLRSISYESRGVIADNWKIKQIHLEPYADSIPRKKFLASDDGKRMLKLCSKRVRIGDVIYRLHYSIDGKRYDEYLFVNPSTKRLVADCSFWGFTAKNQPSILSR